MGKLKELLVLFLNNLTFKKDRRSAPARALSVLFFPLLFVYYEFVILAMSKDIKFFSLSLIPIAFFSLAFGLLIFVIADAIPNRIVSRVFGGFIVVASFVLYGIEYCCMDFYGMYFGIGYMSTMTGQVVGEFSNVILEVVSTRIPQIIVLFVPVFIYFLFILRIVNRMRFKHNMWILAGVVVLVCQFVGFGFARFGEDKNFYTYDYDSNIAMQKFGVITSFRLEGEYKLFGKPELPLPTINPDEPLFTTFAEITEETTVETTTIVVLENGEEIIVTPSPTPTPYPYNVTDIDFQSLYENTSNTTIQGMHLYFGNIMPTQQNEYTGMFEGKNLIVITAEAFSPYVIDKDFTPTLYKLANEGFVFSNYYQPNWHLSTTGGEYACMTGQVPQWIGSSNSFTASEYKYMPYGLGWQFGALGYSTPAWHNGAYTYYNRDKTHANLGYDFSAIGHGLNLPTNTWPASDKEMFEATVDSYIDEYVNNGTKFHAYYMTVSGHCNYSWGANAMSKRNKDAAIAAFPDSSTAVQAYMACNLELEYGLEYLMQRLEEEGIAEDTVIVMAQDHYPYGISNDGVDHYDELSGIDDNEQSISRYLNTLIIWSGSMEEPIYVDTPCSSIDIVPTILNLFGIPYDSRLFAGRDILATNYIASEFSTNMPLVILPMNAGNSWITAAGVYECKSKTFTPYPGIVVNDTYVDDVNDYVSNKWRYSGLLISNDYFKIVMGDD
ncbi:MAG: LTA synthase family protein [Clostridia bacterium]|nr:LTA synthase family protein [Clostridia bacterium]